MDTFLKDVKFALRMVRQAPGFSIVAIVTLALGIGANTAMFSVVRTVLMRPLPFPEPDRIMAVGSTNNSKTISSDSLPDFLDDRARNKSFEHLAMYFTSDKTLTGTGDPLHIQATVVSAGFFETLGVRPALGRTFTLEEEQPGQHVTILSDSMWHSRFGGDPKIIGRTVGIDGRSYVVVGVMPAGFEFPIESSPRDLWITYSRYAEKDMPDDTPITTQRGAHFIQMVGRLKPGVSPLQAQAEMSGIVQSLAQQYPDTNSRRTGAIVNPQLEALVGETRPALLILLAAVAFVLMIACANIANLLLARSTGRTREIAIRAALGADRFRIIRQLITESIVLAVAGAALGSALASWAVTLLVRLYPSNLPRLAQVSIDAPVLFFTIGITFFSAIASGLFPALDISRTNIEQALRQGGRAGLGVKHKRIRASLVIAETALGMLLLVGAGLLIRSYQRLNRVEPGFSPQGIATANFDLPSSRYDNDKSDRFVRDLLRNLRAQPGVLDVAGVSQLPMGNNHASVSFDIEGKNIPQANRPVADIVSATEHYFETMKIPLLQGRTFDERDQRKSNQVTIVSRSFAEKYFPGENPVGKHIQPGATDSPGPEPWREIVGVVGDVHAAGLSVAPEPTYYVPYPQLIWGAPTIVVRSAASESMVVPEIRNVVHSMDGEIPLFDTRSMDDLMALSIGRERFQTVLLCCFAGIALLLTAVGLYGVMAYLVGQRTREIGIRMALGASRRDVLSMVMGSGTRLAIIGLVLGAIGGLALTRFMQSMLYQVRTHDPLTFAIVAFVLGSVALFASYIPARRAANVDPMVALRYD
ncbi:MAG TPA: ABC transporter permease [Terriglobales bacterium]|nr:ABC transporter permease [Terriglobales bacterium]